MAIEGASVKIDDSRIFRTDKGVVLYNGELTLNRNRIRATSVGVAAASGRAVITDNMISGVREHVIYEESRSSVEASGNLVWSRYLCPVRFRERSRGRYEPYWTGDGNRWKCAYGPYRRDWWDDEEGLLGLDYVDDGYTLEGYDAYQQGWGYWVRSGQSYVYFPDRSRYGDERWIEDRGWRRR